MVTFAPNLRKLALIVGTAITYCQTAAAQNQMKTEHSPAQCGDAAPEIAALGISSELKLNAQLPSSAWSQTTPITFCADWQGKNLDPLRQTSIRALWTHTTLYLRFECHYREIYVFDDSETSGRRYQLWDRDVAEAFLQPDPSQLRAYKEFEVSPNGMWVDLDIVSGKDTDLKSGLQRSVWRDEAHKIWIAELAIPMQSLTAKFDPAAVWRVNFFRVERDGSGRFYSAWHATNTPEPNFHVPEVFGKLLFQK